jgi:transposase-like protein
LAQGKAHDAQTRAAVMGALIAGQGVCEVARQFNLDNSIVYRWRDRMPPDKLQKLAEKKGAILDDLIFDYLKANLHALRKQAAIAAEDEYIRKQPANELAVLHGVMADKAVRILEAAASASRPALAPAPPGAAPDQE